MITYDIYPYVIIKYICARLKDIYLLKFIPILTDREGKTSFIGLCTLWHSWSMFLLFLDLGKILIFGQNGHSDMQYHEL